MTREERKRARRRETLRSLALGFSCVAIAIGAAYFAKYGLPVLCA